MYVIYGKGQVGNGVKKILDRMNVSYIIMDDADIDENVLSQASKIIVSPGVPQFHKIYQLRKNKITGEFDICWDILNDLGIINNFEFVGITGTDGKSTTTWMIYNLFKEVIDPIQKTTTWIGGNFEPTLAEVICEILEKNLQNQRHILMLEISSFMAYNIKKFKFDYSIFINFERDHLNWHSDMQDYLNSKMNMIKNTKFSAVISAKILENIKDKTGLNIKVPQSNIEINKTNFVGKHNLENLSLVYTLIQNYIADKKLDISKQTILENIYKIQPLDHRVQFVREIEGISIYDDGKSTTANSLGAGINSFDKKIILIAGGSDKGDAFEVLESDFKKHLGGAILIGQTAPKIAQVLGEAKVDYGYASSMEDAVNLAFLMAKQKNIKIILFSPGCASFDMFKNRLDRVGQFLEAVKNLK